MLKKKLSIILSLVLLLTAVLPGFSVLAADEEIASVVYSTTEPNEKSVELSTNVDGGKIIYTLDGTSPTVDNGTVYTGAVAITEGVIKLTAAVFADGAKMSDDFCHTYINNAGTHLGVQADSSKITSVNTSTAAEAFDGDSVLENPVNTVMKLDRTTYATATTATVKYDTPVTVDTLRAIATVNESAYLTGVSAGANGTNSSGNRGINTEYLSKEFTVDLKVDYIKEGETAVTEGEWQTVTLPVGYKCTWNWTNGYGRAWTYLPAISFEEATVSEITVSIRNFSEGATTSKIWGIKEYELYNSKGITPEVKYSSTNPRTANLASTSPITLSTNVDGGTIIYTLDGTSPALNNGTEYTEGVVIPQGTVRLTSAVFKDGVKVSEDFCHTYVNNPGTHLGVQTNTSKISTDRGTNPKFAFDGDSQYSYPTNSFSVSRTNLPNPIGATVIYDNAITFDTVSPLVTVNEKAYVTNVSAGSSGTNSSGTRADKTEYLTKEMALQFKVDYVKAGETTVTEGEWQTVTMPAGYPCKWSWNGSYGRIYLYTPTIEIGEVTATSVTISVKDYAEDANTAKIWGVKEYELYKSNGISYEVIYSKPSGVVTSETAIELSSNRENTVVRYTTDGSAPSATSTVYSAPITIGSNCTMKINAAVFDTDGNMISDVFSNVYVTGKYTNRAVQTDESKISYTAYTEPNNRLPAYAFDGADEFAGAHSVWTLKALDITVSYDSTVKADAMLISARMDKNIVDEENLVTTENSYITVDVKNGDTSVTGGETVLMLPAGSKVKKASQSDGTNTTISYWAWFGTGDVNNFEGDSITYSITDFYGVGAIKEIELIKTGKVDVTAVNNNGTVVITGTNTYDVPFEVTVIKAGYITAEDMDALLEAKTIVWSIPSGANNEVFEVGQFGEIAGAETVKYFVWEMESLTPLTNSVEVSAN